MYRLPQLVSFLIHSDQKDREGVETENLWKTWFLGKKLHFNTPLIWQSEKYSGKFLFASLPSKLFYLLRPWTYMLDCTPKFITWKTDWKQLLWRLGGKKELKTQIFLKRNSSMTVPNWQSSQQNNCQRGQLFSISTINFLWRQFTCLIE